MIIRKGPRTVLNMERGFRVLPVLIVYLSSVFVSDCSGYFFYSPPARQQYQNQVGINRRSDAGFSRRMDLAPAETLWVGSHKINWSPLPLFLQLTNPNPYRQQQNAQSRNFSPRNDNIFQISSPRSDPYQNNNNNNNNYYQHDIFAPYSAGKVNNNKFQVTASTTSSPVNSYYASPSSTTQSPSPSSPHFNEDSRRSTIQPEIHQFSPVSASITVGQPSTTPLPMLSSTLTSSFFSSSPIVDISTPGVSMAPIIDKLKQMTEWSRQRTLLKKEGKYDPYRLKKKQKKKSKSRDNIEAIILGDNDNDFYPAPKREQKQKRKSKVANDDLLIIHPSTIRESKQMRKSSTDASDDLVIHPTNAALLADPLEVQQSALRKYEINRQDKKMGMFNADDALQSSVRVSFRFGPDDAKPSPYRY